VYNVGSHTRIELAVFKGGRVFQHASKVYETDLIGGLRFISPFWFIPELVLVCTGQGEAIE
jgi:hypothetical protein